MRKIEIGKTYKHFKGHIYKVIDLVYDSEQYPKLMVIYENIVDHDKYPDVKQKYRFEEVD